MAKPPKGAVSVDPGDSEITGLLNDVPALDRWFKGRTDQIKASLADLLEVQT